MAKMSMDKNGNGHGTPKSAYDNTNKAGLFEGSFF